MTQTLTTPQNGEGQLARRERMPISVSDDGQFANLLDTGKFEHMWRVAKLFSSSNMVPAHFHGKTEDCFIAVQMAIRLGVDPFMFLQNTYVHSGKPGMEGKLAIALINSSGLFDGPLRFEFFGKPGSDDYGCRAWTKLKGSGERIDGPLVTIKVAKEEGWFGRNQKWRTVTDLMLQYRAGAWFGRIQCPERLMGMQTIEELHDLGEARPVVSRVLSEARTAAAELTERFTRKPVSEGQQLVNDETGETLAAGPPTEPEEAPPPASPPAEGVAPTDGAEPEMSGVEEDPPALANTPEAIWETFMADAEALAQEAKLDPVQFDRGMKKFLLRFKGATGANGKPWAVVPVKDREAVLQAIAEKSGYFVDAR